jgi:hypothetical protein
MGTLQSENSVGNPFQISTLDSKPGTSYNSKESEIFIFNLVDRKKLHVQEHQKIQKEKTKPQKVIYKPLRPSEEEY